MEVRGYIQWLLPLRKWKVFAIIIASVVAGGGVLTLCILRAHTYLTDDPAACVNCHTMELYYVAWFHSSHSRSAICNGCHVPYENVVKKRVFKEVDGIRHVAISLTRGEKNMTRANGESSEVIMNSCIRYHAQLSIEFAGIERIGHMMSQVGEGKAYWDCHRDVPHGGSNSVASTPNALTLYPDFPTPERLKKMIE